MTEACCPTPHLPEGACQHCWGDGIIELPAGLYDPSDIACPWCQPDAYPDGFPGLKVAGADRWLIPPSAPTAPDDEVMAVADSIAARDAELLHRLAER